MANSNRRRTLLLILGAVPVLALLAFVVVRTWVVPAVILGQIGNFSTGHAAIQSYWVNGKSAGVVGLTLHEGADPGSPVLAAVDRVETDLSLGGLIRGRFLPGKVTVRSPRLAFRLDRNGQPLAKPPLKAGAAGPKGSEPIALPTVEVVDARIEIAQEGRAAFVIAKAAARLEADRDGAKVSATADDPTWGRWSGDGRFDAGFTRGGITLANPGLAVDLAKVRALPFVPLEVWASVAPEGLVAARIHVGMAPDPKGNPAPTARVEVDFKGTKVTAPGMGLDVVDTSGGVTVEGGLVTVRKASGKALDGVVGGDGVLDFARPVPRVDLNLTLDKIALDRAPAAWQLGELQATGRMSGKAHLLATLQPGFEPDLSGSSGEAIIEGGTFQGIPIKSLKLEMTAEGADLQYGTKAARLDLPRLNGGPILAGLAAGLAALQAPPAPARPPSAKPKPKLPRSISSQIELEDVELNKLTDRLEKIAGIKLPVPIAGKLSIKAEATIPLGSLKSIKGYTFKGRATLSGASIDGVDLGRVEASLALEDGVLDLSDFRGQFVNRPAGSPDAPPAATGSVPNQGPLPPGAFRGRVRAELDPKGKIIARFDAEQVPIGELAASFLPKPTPLAGELTLDFEAAGDVERAVDPRAWTVAGRFASDRIAYRGTTLSAITGRIGLKGGKAELADFQATVGGRPIGERIGAEAVWPDDKAQPVAAKLFLIGVDTAVLAALAPNPLPLAGKVTATLDARLPLATPEDLRAYVARGEAKLEGASMYGLDLGRVHATLALADGVLELVDFQGRFVDRPAGNAQAPPEPTPPLAADAPLPTGAFRGQARAELMPLGKVTARFAARQIPIGELAAPALPRPTPLAGLLDLELQVDGSADRASDPRAWTVAGRIAGDRISYQGAAFSAVAARLELADGRARIADVRATVAGKPVGGQIDAEARFPELAGQPVEGSIVANQVDVSTLAALVPDEAIAVTGRADARVDFALPADGSDPRAEAKLSAPGLAVQGFQADAIAARLRVQGGAIIYEVTAEGLGGKLKFQGEIPLSARTRRPAVDARVQVTSLDLGRLWGPLKLPAEVRRLDGSASVDANLRRDSSGSGFWAHGFVEAAGLVWDRNRPIGRARGTVASGPASWRLDPINGELLGGTLQGSAWGEMPPKGPPRTQFNLRVDRLALKRLAAIAAPALRGPIDGVANIRLVGVLAESLRATAEVRVARASVLGVPITELHLPAELVLAPSTGAGSVHARRWTARVAGGRLQGDIQLQLGRQQSYRADLQVADLDIESIMKLQSTEQRQSSGRISGKVALNGTDAADVRTARGRADLTLSDASLFSLPVFREIGGFMVGSRDGVFDRGELNASIGNRQITIESLSLDGQHAELHATGTVGFDGRLALEVLINTPQIIPQHGQSLLAIIPGLREAGGRSAEAASKFGNFLSNKLLKLRVAGTIDSPTVSIDPAVLVSGAAMGFFSQTFGLPLNLIR